MTRGSSSVKTLDPGIKSYEIAFWMILRRGFLHERNISITPAHIWQRTLREKQCAAVCRGEQRCVSVRILPCLELIYEA